MTDTTIWVGLKSKIQDAFHKELLQQYLTRKNSPDWELLLIGTEEEVTALLDKLQNERNNEYVQS